MNRTFKAVVAALMLGFTFASSVAAGPFEDALATYEKGNSATALRLARPFAEQGNLKAQAFLGAMYEHGAGVLRDYVIAVSWYRKAAEQGEAMAQFNLGGMYHDGHGVPQDYAAALSWWRKAAEQSNARAQANVGQMYFYGQGVRQDYAAAVSWYRKAAEQGEAVAQLNLGLMYGKGQGVPQDYVIAHLWFNLAASTGHETAVKARDIVAALMTPAQIAEAQKLAREWKPTSIPTAPGSAPMSKLLGQHALPPARKDMIAR